MPGFIFRLVVCNALCIVLSLPVLRYVTVPLMESRDWGYLGTALLAIWVLLALPIVWFRTYRWLEEYGKR